MKLDKQYALADEIISNMERYRGLIDILINNDTEEMARTEASKFNNHLKLFRNFYDDSEGIDVDEKNRDEDSLQTLLDSALIEALDAEN